MADNYIARKQTKWVVISILPDVCKTPIGPATPPIPYPVIAQMNTSSNKAPTVKANGHHVVVFEHSFIPSTLGDEPGVAKGIKSGTVGGKCYPFEHSSSVRVMGKEILRHGDLFWMNGA